MKPIQPLNASAAELEAMSKHAIPVKPSTSRQKGTIMKEALLARQAIIKRNIKVQVDQAIVHLQGFQDDNAGDPSMPVLQHLTYHAYATEKIFQFRAQLGENKRALRMLETANEK